MSYCPTYGSCFRHFKIISRLAALNRPNKCSCRAILYFYSLCWSREAIISNPVFSFLFRVHIHGLSLIIYSLGCLVTVCFMTLVNTVASSRYFVGISSLDYRKNFIATSSRAFYVNTLHWRFDGDCDAARSSQNINGFYLSQPMSKLLVLRGCGRHP